MGKVYTYLRNFCNILVGMWSYSQSTGELVDALGEVIGSGYSGLGADKNNPSAENVQGEGPIPLAELY